MSLLEVNDLRAYFHTRNGIVRAVDGVSFSIERGETLGIVGESGSGKSVTGYSLLGLVPSPPGRIESGTAWFDGVDLLACSSEELRRIRGKRISMVFQDPMTALNPYMTVGDQVGETLVVHDGMSWREANRQAAHMLESVGLQDISERMSEYPHQFSGGMRQRVMIAMALITRPEILIADEPTTALDVTVQAQILEIMKQMQRELGMAVILVTHNLGIVAGTCDRILVMYAGRILEAASVSDLYRRPRHPYTEAIMAALPSVDEKRGRLNAIPGLPPDLSAEMPGCPFAPRCAYAAPQCREGRPELREVERNHASACVRVQAGELRGFTEDE